MGGEGGVGGEVRGKEGGMRLRGRREQRNEKMREGREIRKGGEGGKE